ncbi:nitrate ABC transporter substrate-binding protein [Demequina mangrovi]|uniref:ABC-type nitrate/sulfonate/bicarbonate transport system, substrate-binding protein n=1 Tax=Demequina mangrovi TaxID=1043493 RepID=A0A1H7A1W6_9MICO|nr:nitrate ABC transporter substrate-binding protein [Demequina mangrovi]SEJ59689.1 ABC-type nitrate/sulfonate/bicarbonate transport system, substrate-binding protein [Demequina mangrovi]
MTKPSPRAFAATGLVIAGLTLTACSSSDEPEAAGTSGTTSSASPAAAGAVDLAAAGCPADIRIQTDWNPEAEHGHLYALFGDEYTIDTDEKSVTGPLMASGEATGVDVTVLAGGPATGFTQPNAQMYNDPSIFLAYVGTDEAIAHAADLPTVGVFAPLEKDPQMIMWDPETYPEVEGIADLGEAGATIRVFGGGTYIDYFVGAGVLSEDQIDATYDGLPAVFVSEGGAIAQQGFASAEPFIYENEVPEWGKAVSYELINDAGYPKYAAVMSVIPENITEYSDCLTALVPVLQQAELDFYASPDSTVGLILELVEEYDTGWVYSEGVAAYSVETQLGDGLVGNGTDDVMGNLDADRVAELFEIVKPIYEDQGFEIPADLTAEDLYTNEFVDESLGF